MYVVKQQLSAEFSAHVEKLTVDFTTWDAIFVVEGQRIPTMVNTVIETVNEITTNYESLHDQSSGSSSGFSGSSLSSSSGSSQLSFSDIISTTRKHFKILFDKIMADNNYSLDDMCNMVFVEICRPFSYIYKLIKLYL
ncbi:hypothetical protein C2G38_2167774 [Gigaspora rosea]|uniref:Uncharacterized protein n=1 Tax=Gigaspora rosea TaxID=44941 RepID=A0A397VQB8_9GLOM|nr:hypothetical protein C2G38_2167774 [Gigaspora rosea]